MKLISISMAALTIAGINPIIHKSASAAEKSQNISTIENKKLDLTEYKLVDTKDIGNELNCNIYQKTEEMVTFSDTTTKKATDVFQIIRRYGSSQELLMTAVHETTWVYGGSTSGTVLFINASQSFRYINSSLDSCSFVSDSAVYNNNKTSCDYVATYRLSYNGTASNFTTTTTCDYNGNVTTSGDVYWYI